MELPQLFRPAQAFFARKLFPAFFDISNHRHPSQMHMRRCLIHMHIGRYNILLPVFLAAEIINTLKKCLVLICSQILWHGYNPITHVFDVIPLLHLNTLETLMHPIKQRASVWSKVIIITGTLSINVLICTISATLVVSKHIAKLILKIFFNVSHVITTLIPL